VDDRLDRHRSFVRERDDPPTYEAAHYDFSVVTKQERRIRLYVVSSVERAGDGEQTGDDERRYAVSYEPR
jgi:site-specific DNA-methyltransferase (adenine-specific)